jgi:hypothetical protein
MCRLYFNYLVTVQYVSRWGGPHACAKGAAHIYGEKSSSGMMQLWPYNLVIWMVKAKGRTSFFRKVVLFVFGSSKMMHSSSFPWRIGGERGDSSPLVTERQPLSMNHTPIISGSSCNSYSWTVAGARKSLKGTVSRER